MVSAVPEKMGQPRTSVTGSMLSRYIDQDVRLIGLATKTNPVDSFEIQTADNVLVLVKVKEPLDEPVEGLVEVQGRVLTRDTVNAESFIAFPPSLGETFDLTAYSEAVIFTGSYPNPWTIDN